MTKCPITWSVAIKLVVREYHLFYVFIVYPMILPTFEDQNSGVFKYICVGICLFIFKFFRCNVYQATITRNFEYFTQS